MYSPKPKSPLHYLTCHPLFKNNQIKKFIDPDIFGTFTLYISSLLSTPVTLVKLLTRMVHWYFVFPVLSEECGIFLGHWVPCLGQ